MNWIKQKSAQELSARDKIIDLLKINYKLLLIHECELLSIRSITQIRGLHNTYISRLYTHYIINGLSKQEFRS